MRNLGLVVGALALAACHRVQFGDITHTISATKHDTAIVAVIDETTLAQTVSFRSGAAWWTHRYDVKPGVMLKQMADAELPQMFTHYEVANTYRPPSEGKGITLVLSVLRYAFRGFHAIATVHAAAYDASRKRVFEKDYTHEGRSQSGKIVWGGAYAIPSAVRQSSYDAYERIMADLRQDLDRALRPAVAQHGTASPAASASVEHRLRGLRQLRAEGLISDQEYEAKRRELLDQM
jgi:hypothetical protein